APVRGREARGAGALGATPAGHRRQCRRATGEGARVMPPPRALRSFYAAMPPSTLEDALSWARFFYDDSQSWEQEGFDRPDTLHRVEVPAAALIDLLRDDINRQRIIWE